MKIYRCIKSDWKTQGFYDNLACIKSDTYGHPLLPLQVLPGTYPGTCPIGSTKLYPALGMKAHGGIDRACFYKEPGYFDTEASDVTWKQFIEIDNAGGLGIDIASDKAFVPCTEGCPEGTLHFIKRRYWHSIIAVVKGEEWSYEQCKNYIAGRERALVASDIQLGDKILLGDSTGLSGGNHVHDALKWCNENGDGIHTNNGYFGAFDLEPYSENKFVIDLIQERKELEQKAEEIVRLEAQIRASQLTLLQLLTSWVFLLQQQIQKFIGKVGSTFKQ